MAAAAVGSAFSTSIQSLNRTRSKTLIPCFSDHFLIITPAHVASVSFSLGTELMPIIGHASNKWPRMQRISAAVTQEEAASTAEEKAEVKEEDQQVSSGGEGNGSSSVISPKLYFGNVPYHCDSAKLAGLIQQYGTPELIEVLYDKDTGRSRGFAFVTMSCVEDCKRVIEKLDGSEYGGRILKVNFADKPKPKVPLYPETDYKLFVGNLTWSVTSETLTEVFQEYGDVVGARVIYDGETGRSRGFGFVCFNSESDMGKALESSDGVEIDGRLIRVNLATGRQQ